MYGAKVKVLRQKGPVLSSRTTLARLLLSVASLIAASPAMAFPDSYTAPVLVVQDGKEYKSRTSYRNDSGSTANASKHVFLTNIKFTYGKWSTEHLTDPAGDFYSMSNTPRGGTPILWQPGTPLVFQNVEWTYDSVADGTYLDTASVNDDRGRGSANAYYVVSATELGVTGTADNVAISQGGSTYAALRNSVVDQDIIPAHLASTGALSGSSMVIMIKADRDWHRLIAIKDIHNLQTNAYIGTAYFWDYMTETKWTNWSYDVRKLLCLDSGIDSRKVYAQPNDAGALPGADINSPLRDVNFTEWHYKGGLFVGQMLTSSGDMSGKARIQLYPQGGGILSNTKLSVLSLLYMSKPGHVTGDLETKAYIPDLADTNIGVAASAARWSNRWEPTSGAIACETVTFNSSTPEVDYVNYKMSYSGAVSTPLAFIMATQEGTGSFQGWRYFASKDYQDLTTTTTFPGTDSRPRLWVVDETSVTTW